MRDFQADPSLRTGVGTLRQTGTRRDREAAFGAVAARQHGVITRGQLLDVGLSRSAIRRLVETGRLRTLHAGVYILGPVEDARALETAAMLAGGPGAALSHTSALRLLSLRRCPERLPLHVTVAGNGRSRRPGIVFHRASRLRDDELTVVDGIRVTTVGRTLVDVVPMLARHELERIVAEAEREGLLHATQLAELPARYPHRAGMAVLRGILAQPQAAQFTRSEAERRCRDLLRTAGLPTPHANVAIGPYELDLFWPHENVALEIDGWAHHSSRAQFENDRRRDNWLRARGVEVVRLTWQQITRDPIATAVQVGQIFALARARRGQTGAPGPASL